MAEDVKKNEEKKESKGSNLVQLRFSDITRDQLSTLADDVGFNLNTYLYHIVAEKIENKTSENQYKFNKQKDIANHFGFIKMDTIIPPKKIIKLINEKIKTTIKTDFTGNKKSDYILFTENDNKENYKIYWINSNLQIVKKTRIYPDGQYSFRLVNIDNDKEPDVLAP